MSHHAWDNVIGPKRSLCNRYRLWVCKAVTNGTTDCPNGSIGGDGALVEWVKEGIHLAVGRRGIQELPSDIRMGVRFAHSLG